MKKKFLLLATCLFFTFVCFAKRGKIPLDSAITQITSVIKDDRNEFPCVFIQTGGKHKVHRFRANRKYEYVVPKYKSCKVLNGGKGEVYYFIMDDISWTYDAKVGGITNINVKDGFLARKHLNQFCRSMKRKGYAKNIYK